MTELESPAETLTNLVESWLRGVDDITAANALVALGARPDFLGQAAAAWHPPGPGIIDWALSPDEFRHRAIADPTALGTSLSAPDAPAWRLAVQGDVDPARICEWLLRSPAVASAFAVVKRPPGSLRQRPWRWPLRVGLAGFHDGAAEEMWSTFESEHEVLPRLVMLTQVEAEPAAVDVLVVAGPLPYAMSVLHEHEPIANAVLVLSDPVDRWAVISAEMATARALTAAVAAGVVGTNNLLASLTELIIELSHARPFDFAVTKAFDRRLLLTAEPEGMGRAALPEMARQGARAARAALAAAPELFLQLMAAADSLDRLADGLFSGESEEATSVVAPGETIESALGSAEQERWLQARVSAVDSPVGAFRRGMNDIAVFIGPQEAGAVAAPQSFDESALPWDQDVEGFRLTVAFVPLVPTGPPQEAELELPRFGRTRNDASFVLDVPPSSEEVVTRIVVLFRNRILQTALLRGFVDKPVRLVDVTAVFPILSGLDDRRAFDIALLANHAAGIDALIRHSSGHTFVAMKKVLEVNANRLGEVLGKAVYFRGRQGLDSKQARRLLIDLAVEGRDFHKNLGAAVGALDGSRIQLVTASSEWLLPIELAYDRYAPNNNATLCPRYLAGEVKCSEDCAPINDRSIVCPNAFWGISKTIERHHFDPTIEAELDRRLLALKNPRFKRRTLRLERSVLGTSTKVVARDRKATLGCLGEKAMQAIGWDAWIDALRDADVQLLVLMPHTDYTAQPLMEIDAETLARGMLEPDYVTGLRDVDPVVVLFGCATSGNADDPAGFASRFSENGAAVVFHSSTQLLATHAVALSQRLADLLRADGPSRPISDVLAEFRSNAVREGLLAAFAIQAFGDADWRI